MNLKKKFFVEFAWYDSDIEEPRSMIIAYCDTLKECIKAARKFTKDDPTNYFKSFKWNRFAQVNHNFSVIENGFEIIEGMKVDLMIARLNMEEVMHEMGENPEMENLSIVYHLFN